MVSPDRFTTPILLILFNRPDLAKLVLSKLQAVRPIVLYVAIDGPREGHATDSMQVAQCVALLDLIDWPCTIHRLIRDNNLGCKQSVSSAIDWFFDEVEEGIILEDDCLPDLTFFSFCADLLTRYRHDVRVMHIGGANLAAGNWWGSDSYLFTKVCHIWGWASWRRAWQHYDLAMTNYPMHRSTLLNEQVSNKKSRRYWQQVFDDAYANRVDTWDYQWVYSIWLANGLCVLPAVNMVTNIGFGREATHTKIVTEFAELTAGSLRELHHPTEVIHNEVATDWLFQTLYTLPSTLTTWINKVKRRVSSLKKTVTA